MCDFENNIWVIRQNNGGLTNQRIMKKFNTISNLIIQLKLEPNILKDLSYINEKGLTRKISKTVIENIIKFLYPK